MASAHNPSASIPIKAVPSTSATPAVVQSSPGKRKELTVDALEREIRRLDRGLVVVVLLLTFFLASFTATNSDLWMHLATGRLIAQGQYQFGADPFSYTSGESGQPWINHAWLADLLAYGVSALFGGPESSTAGAVLVAVKAVLIVALAGFMLLCCRRGPSLWLPAIFVAMAILAMSPRLLLQTRCYSFVFLGLTLYLLQRPRPVDGTWPRHLFLLPVLFALWVNLDSWFLLGPLTVALYLLGQFIQRAVSSGKGSDTEPRPDEFRQLAIILVVGLFACLLNPFHVRAFALPEELWALVNTGAWVRDDPYLQIYLASPLRPWMGWTSPSLAYYALLALGLTSFFVASAWSWWRLLVWLAFAVVSLMLTRAIPFFAVAGGIIAALNWQDFVVQRFGARPSLEPRRKNWSLLGRTLTLLVGLVLLALAWPGWLDLHAEQARQAQRTHRVGWAIEVDPSLHAAALKLAELRANNVLTDEDHGFNFSPDMANYCAWFCPREKGFIDFRYPLFRNVLSTFSKLREALRMGPDGVVRTDTDWPVQFRERRINHVIVSTSGNLSGEKLAVSGGERNREVTVEAPGGPLLSLKRFWAFPERWTMLYGDGRTAIFGWIDPRDRTAAQRWTGHEVDLNRLAFGSTRKPDDRVAETDREPGEAVNPGVPRPVSWWAPYTAGPAPRPLAVDEATMYRLLFEDTLQRRRARAEILAHFTMMSQQAFLRVGPGPTLFLGPPSHPSQLWDRLFRAQNTGPSPALLLAIRAARGALAANPNDADAYRELGLAYSRLFETFERGYQNPSLQQLRQVQIITAFASAHTLKPDGVLVHENLAQMYRQMFVEPLVMNLPQVPPRTSFIDLEIEHLEAIVNLLRAAGPLPVRQEDGTETRKETPKEFTDRIEDLEKKVKQREKEVDLQRRRNDYEVTTANKPPFEKARRAVELGLVKQALEVLKDQVELPEEARELAIRLYLATGEVEPLLALKPEELAGDWNNFLLRAAVGDYQRAESYLEQMVRGKEPMLLRDLLTQVRRQSFQAGLQPGGLWALIQAPSIYAGQVNDWVLWGLLALEAGATDQAAERFRKARDIAVGPHHRAIALAPLAAASPLEALVVTRLAGQRAFSPVARGSMLPLANGYLELLREAEHATK